MATGIIATRRRLLLRLAYFVEGRFADVQECTNEGGGNYETRPEYLRKYRRVELRDHPDGARAALLLLTAGARTRFQVLRDTLIAKRDAGTATEEERDIVDLPAEATLDATWDAAV